MITVYVVLLRPGPLILRTLDSVISIHWHKLLPHHSHCNDVQHQKQTDILFLDREIQNRKKAFGIEIYDLMAELETDMAQDAAAKETKIRTVFDAARKDIAVFQAKKDCKNEEMAVLDAESGVMAEAPSANQSTNMIPPSSGTVVTNTHPSENI